jgi:hypothetical protein
MILMGTSCAVGKAHGASGDADANHGNAEASATAGFRGAIARMTAATSASRARSALPLQSRRVPDEARRQSAASICLP